MSDPTTGTASVERPGLATVDSLPPTAYLIMEVLAARYRLGETWWTFPRKTGIRTAADSLEALGFVTVFSGITQGTFRIALTPYGIQSVLSPTYVPPAFQ
jgi:hypothetical protein